MIPPYLFALGYAVPYVEGYGYRLRAPFSVHVTPLRRASHAQPDPRAAKRWLAELESPRLVAHLVGDKISSNPQRALDELIAEARRSGKGLAELIGN